MKEYWRYYGFLRQWVLLLVLGLVLGCLTGAGLCLTRNYLLLPTVKASITLLVEEPSGEWISQARFNVSSNEYPDPKKTIQSIIENTVWLDAQPAIDVTIEGISIDLGCHSSLWKSVLLGGLLGGLIVIGSAYLWNDIRSYMRHNQETDSEGP